MIKILIADDHAIIRDGLKAMLDDHTDIEIVGTADDGNKVLEFLQTREVDIVLMDISMPGLNGIEATKIISINFPEIKVIALTIHEQHEYIRHMIKAGVKGYVLKDAEKEELVQAIITVSKGKKYYSEKVMDKLTSSGAGEETNLLTDREKQILKLIAEEMTNPEIAEKLFLSVRTVDTHRRNLIQKLGVKNTAGLVKQAYNLNLI